MPSGQVTRRLESFTTSLAVEAGPSRGLVLEVEDAGGGKRTRPIGLLLRIGAGRECDLVLGDKTVSRVHAEVRAVRSGVIVADQGSTNGTRVNGAIVREAFVPIGGFFRVGESTCRVVDNGAPRLPPSTRDRFGALVGESVAMREIFAVLERVAPTDATVLIEGQSGTGKELAARALHDHSPRARGRFVAFDCGSVTPSLMQSALLGHKRGAFSGAVSDRPGAFVEAHGGTIFLDELGELSLETQTQLLRVLETRQVTPVGDDRARPVDVRVVAATNRDLFAMVDQGRFRLDLLHRLAVVHVHLPALAQRLDDLPILIRTLYDGRGLKPGAIEGENLARLRAHTFPGNVRELRNVLERSLVLAPPDATEFVRLPLWLGADSPKPGAAHDALVVDDSLPYKAAKDAVLARFDRAYLEKLLARFDGNLTHASHHAGLSRRHLRVLATRAGLRTPSAQDSVENDALGGHGDVLDVDAP